jgi:hypothetical protein
MPVEEAPLSEEELADARRLQEEAYRKMGRPFQELTV